MLTESYALKLRSYLIEAPGGPRLWALNGVLVAASGALVLGVVSDLPHAGDTLITTGRLAWWQLAVLFGLSEVLVVHFRLRREATSYAMGEIPLVLGLLFVSPHALVSSQLVGAAVTLLVHRRQHPVKLVFNLAQLALSTGLAAVTFAALTDGSPTRGGTWIAAAAAAVCAATVSALVVQAAIRLAEGQLRWAELPRVLLMAETVAVTNTGLVLGAVAMAGSVQASGWLYAVPLVALFLAYRGYVREHERRRQLAFLCRASRLLEGKKELDSAIAELLGAVCEMFRAAGAAMTLAPVDGRSGTLHTLVTPEGPKLIMEPVDGEPVDGKPIDGALPAGDRKGQRLAVPLRVADRMVGELSVVAPRERIADFSAADRHLLGGLATQVSVWLDNGRLESSLRQLTELEQQLRHQAFHDPLTGLANRKLLRERMDAAIADTDETDARATVLLLDLDDFKTINDSLGHLAGDQLLVEVATRVRRCVRPDDVVARLGGDEFAVLLASGSDLAAAWLAGKRILEELRRPFALGGRSIRVEASVGIGEAGTADDSNGLLRNADAAMYRAKRGGKNQVRVFEEGLRQEAIDRLEVREELEYALAHDQLTLRFQPLVDLQSGAVNGAEALVRWQHPRRGLLGPATFIPLAEETGLIIPLGRWVLRRALATAAAWRGAEGGSSPSVMTVNLSVRQLADTGLAEHIAGLLAEYDLPGSALILEITESALMADGEEVLAALEAFRALGIRLAVDDFGTGYSALSYLRRLPVDVLKISKSFVDDLDASAEGAAIVQTIVQLGDALDLRTVAEGVERASQLAALRAMGCATGQGFHFGHPVTYEAFSWARRSTDPITVERRVDVMVR